MGAYFGPEEVSMGATKANPRGYWERQDVMQLNEFILHSVDCYWDKVANFSINKLPNAVLGEFKSRASSIVAEMDAHRPWMLKDPRLCLLFEIWKEQFELPVCVHIWRNPLEVAQSLLTRDGIPIHVGIALWEKYNLSALKVSQGLPRLTVSHNNLVNSPEIEVKHIYEQLIGFGLDRLRMPSTREIASFVRKELYHERAEEEKLTQYLNGEQMRMFKAFLDGRVLKIRKEYQLSATAKTILSEYEQNRKSVQAAKHAQENDSKLMTELRNQHTKTEEELYRQIEKQKQAVISIQSEANKLTTELKKQHAQREQALNQQIESQVKKAKDAREEASRVEVELKKQHAEREQALNQQIESQVNETKMLVAEFDKRLEQQNEVLLEIRRTVAVLEKELAKIESQKLDLEKELETRDSELRSREKMIAKLEVEVTSGIHATSDALKLAEVRLQDIEQLVRWLHIVEFHLGSWRWRAGRLTLGKFAKLIGKTDAEIDADHINKVLANFKTRGYSKHDISVGELAVMIDGDKEEKKPDRHLMLIQSSGLFDTNWYLKEYPDVKENEMNPIEHYLKIGAKEYRNPNPDFDTKSYVQKHPNVVKSGINPLEHFILYGREEFRQSQSRINKAAGHE